MLLAVSLMSAAIAAAPLPVSDTGQRQVHYSIHINATPEQVWAAWSTAEGLQTFFSPAARIELRTLGRFDIHFDPAAADGRKGAEGNLVLAVEPNRMLTTTWDAPPEYPAVRAQRTFLEVRLSSAGARGTTLTLTHSGFGSSEEWVKVHEYFTGAWTWVLSALQYRFDEGPINWSSPPDLTHRMKSIGGEAATKWLKQVDG